MEQNIIPQKEKIADNFLLNQLKEKLKNHKVGNKLTIDIKEVWDQFISSISNSNSTHE